MGEKYVEQFCHRHVIVRTAWLYSLSLIHICKKSCFNKLSKFNEYSWIPSTL